ncbi:MAG: hypothetical protein MUF73_04710 [Rhodobacteraceae bacterium]|nr:hypothetical protein [Paracoccaceae bacterium]
MSLGRFARCEDGAVTVDWVVLTAAVVGLGLVIGPTVGQNTVGLSNAVANEVATVEIHQYD